MAGDAGPDEGMDWHAELRSAIAAEQGTDAGAAGGGIQGFKPSASTAWRDSEFARQQHIPVPYNPYAHQDVNEQGWLPR